MTAPLVLDAFAGPGGWDTGLRLAGYTGRILGIEHDMSACRTAVAARHPRVRADVAAFPLAHLAGKVVGVIQSPPCGDFSTAGQTAYTTGKTGHLIDQPIRYVTALRPEWTAWEQVPAVLPFWRRYAAELAVMGYSVWCGELNAADYGVPQERKRAVLIASRTRQVQPPSPTHAERTGGLFGPAQQWVTMAATLGLGPGWIYDSGQNSAGPGGTRVRYVRSCDRPCGTVTGKTTTQWVLTRGDERRKLTVADSAVLQGFPRDYPFTGTTAQRAQQVGDAVPPPLAAAILRPLVASLTSERAA